MQLLITHGSLARTRVLHFQRWQLVLAALALVGLIMGLSGTVYHFVFLKAAREGWPVVSPLVRLIVRDEVAQRDRFMRENLDAIAQKVGEMQAKLVKLEAMGERVSGMAGVKPEERQQLQRGSAAGGAARGGPFVPASRPSLEQLQTLVAGLDEVTDLNTDLFTLAESRLLENRLAALLIPSATAGGRPCRVWLRGADRPLQRATGAARRAGLPCRTGHPRLRRRRWHGFGQRMARGLRQPAGNRPWQRFEDSLCAQRQCRRGPGCPGAPRSASGQGRKHRPVDRSTPALRGARGWCTARPRPLPGRPTGRGEGIRRAPRPALRLRRAATCVAASGSRRPRRMLAAWLRLRRAATCVAASGSRRPRRMLAAWLRLRRAATCVAASGSRRPRRMLAAWLRLRPKPPAPSRAVRQRAGC
jgi:hypothetical protein